MSSTPTRVYYWGEAGDGTFNMSSSSVYYIKSGTKSGSNYVMTCDQYTAESKTTYYKGTTQYSDVTSTSRSGYPDNNASGSYWYVYKGVY